MASGVARSRLLRSLRGPHRNLLVPSSHITNYSNSRQESRNGESSLGFRACPILFPGGGLGLTNLRMSRRSYSSSSSTDNLPGSGGGDGPTNWMDRVKIAWDSVVEAVNYSGQKAKEVSDQLTPHVHQVLDAHPNVKDVVFPLGTTLLGTTLAWLVMPGIFRTLHKYASRTPMYGTQVPYEKSFWGALEDPVRYLVTFIALTQIGMLVAPSTVAMQYAGQVYRGAAIVSVIWFLYRWKTNVVSRALASGNTVIDPEKLYTLDRIGSVGLFVIGLMALAESCGVAVQSILTVGGIGGVATAFAARDILGNILSGLSMQFFRPFSLGDTIKAGSIEGQVVEMGLTTTLLVNAEKFPVIVPNSLFSSQVIVNKSQAIARAVITKIPLTVDSLDKIPQISNDIKIMLNSNQLVFKDNEAPYCFLSRIESSFAELTIGFNLKHMSKAELFSTQQEILLQAVEIIKKHRANLGSTWQSSDGH